LPAHTKHTVAVQIVKQLVKQARVVQLCDAVAVQVVVVGGAASPAFRI
jgi:hypothetical protein